MNNPSPFRLALAANIKKTIAALRADGTVGMGLDNLRVVTPVPPGAPLGTNAAWVYREIFNEVAPKVAGKFLI